MRTISEKTQTKIAQAVSKTTSAEKAKTLALDSLIADGFDKPSDFVSPKSKGSTVTPEEFEALKAAIVAGFTADVRKLLAKPVKSLSAQQRSDRRYSKQQINARISDFKRQITKRLAGDEGKAPSRNKTADQKIRERLTEVLKVCQKAASLDFNVNDMVKAIKQALAIIK